MEERPIKKTRNCETPPAAMSASMSQHPLEASRPLPLSVAVQQEEDPAASPERPEAAPTAPVQRDITPSLEGIHIAVTTQALPPSFESTITHHLLGKRQLFVRDTDRSLLLEIQAAVSLMACGLASVVCETTRVRSFEATLWFHICSV